jgi:hypothetical protein
MRVQVLELAFRVSACVNINARVLDKAETERFTFYLQHGIESDDAFEEYLF